ncbi:hypothetical protein GWK47_029651 [Chionoecetes opilio]|uniref:Uncharacterized protein n=1 Tax=Chionoecetes opilio TaxID=41210 RepID=A0A8J4YSB3_CHIOP|nr:hypothetical protein GWK47_029651 [Chionoecetes opilio]
MRLLQGPQLPQLHQQQQQKQQKYQQHQQLQQQQVQLHPSSMVHPTQQLPNRSQPYLQQSQPIQAQPQIETTSQQGRVALGMHTAPVGTNNVISSSAQMTPSFTISTAMDSDKNTTAPTNRVMLTHSMQGNSFTLNTDTNIKKVKYIVSVPSIVNSVNPEAHFQHNLQSVNPASSSKVTSFSLPSGSHATTTTVNTNDTNLPTSVNMGVNQPKAGTSSAPVPYTAGGTSQECGNNELLCKMCGTAGIFTCCNNVIYCSTACQVSTFIIIPRCYFYWISTRSDFIFQMLLVSSLLPL